MAATSARDPNYYNFEIVRKAFRFIGALTQAAHYHSTCDSRVQS